MSYSVLPTGLPTLALALAGLIAATPAGAEDLRSAFYALPKPDRVAVQLSLAGPGLYVGEIDGLWGPGTARAVDAAQSTLAWPGYLETARDAGVRGTGPVIWAYLGSPDFPASLPGWR